MLGAHLLDCTGLVLAARNRTLHQIFGTPDDVKCRACMTLFSQAGGQPIFAEALRRSTG